MGNFDAVNRHAEQAAQLLKVLGHPERLLVLCQLIDGEKNVSELLQQSALSKSAFSQQLALLRQHQLVTTRKRANQVFYALSSAMVRELLAVLHANFCALEQAQPEAETVSKHPDALPPGITLDPQEGGRDAPPRHHVRRRS
mgnify:CR=1 FL=1